LNITESWALKSLLGVLCFLSIKIMVLFSSSARTILYLSLFLIIFSSIFFQNQYTYVFLLVYIFLFKVKIISLTLENNLDILDYWMFIWLILFLCKE
jgi:hypothetical protein